MDAIDYGVGIRTLAIIASKWAGSPFFGESEFNMPQAYGHACPPAIDNSECEQHEWNGVSSFDGEVTEYLCVCKRCGDEYDEERHYWK